MNTSIDILLVLGTRPEIIKLAPVIRALDQEPSLSYRLVHTDQHYDDELSDVFFRDLGIPEPDARIGVGSGRQGEQTAEALVGIEAELIEHEPKAVMALGDTNAVLSTAVATSKLPPAFVHLEAGIRSFDYSMPEEVNRVLADAVTDIAFAPTDTAVDNLTDEAAPGDIYQFGNTIVDACLEHVGIASERSNVLSKLDVDPDEFAVATIHRPRNTDDRNRLKTIISVLGNRTFPVLFPAHPRTRNAISEAEIELKGSLHLLDPLDYLDFLRLLSEARVVVTDSGGIQEEASILETPCLTVRPNTERPETVEAGVNKLVDSQELAQTLDTVFEDDSVNEAMTGHPYLYGKGDTAEQIVNQLVSRFAHI